MQLSVRTTLPAVAFFFSLVGQAAPPARAYHGNLPLAFEPNSGQFDPQVRFRTHSRGMTVFFTKDEAVMVLRKGGKTGESAVVRMKLEGASKSSDASGLEKLPGISNYFIGNDPAKWRTDIPNYARIRYPGVYPGVDLLCYGNGHDLEYDLVVAPGADPNRIELAWEGADRMDLNGAGDLVLATPLGDVTQKRPRVYQEIAGRRVEVAASYAMHVGGRVTFALARYDQSRPLVIDPITVAYGTYLGYSYEGDGIAVDATGAAYVTGYTNDNNFPTKTPFQSHNRGNYNTFVSKIAPGGSSLVYSTYLGGTDGDSPNGIAVDANGAAYIVGTAGSLDFPLANAYQTSCPNDVPGGQYGGVFVTKLVPAGNALAYSTYLCGGYSDHAGGIAVDSSGSAYITGDTSSDHWPFVSAYQPQLSGGTNAFVTKLSPAGNSLVYSTYLGNSNDYGKAIAIDGTGAAYITGETDSDEFPVTASAFDRTYKSAENDVTGFVAKLSPTGTSLVYATYLGGTGAEHPKGIAVDSSGAAYITGYTFSTDFPLKAAFQSTNKNPDAGTGFLTKLAPSGSTLVYSTYLGGTANSGTSGDFSNAVAVNSAGEAYLTGYTFSADFPLMSPVHSRIPSSYVAFVTKFSASGGALIGSTFLGGTGDTLTNAMCLDSADAVYVTGNTTSDDFPTPNGFQKTTSTSGGPFIDKLQITGPTTTTVTTSPGGLTFTVDGTSYTATQVFTWTSGSTHTIAVTSPQTLPSVSGTRYAFSNWSDSGLQSHTVTASTTGATYTANFTAQYQLAVTITPVGGGNVTSNPSSSDTFYNTGTSVQLTAAASSGYSFTGWGGDLGGTTNPQSVMMTATRHVTAIFSNGTSQSPVLSVTKTHAGNFTVGQSGASYSITISNQAGAGATSGMVTVTDTIPSGLTLLSMSGSGWTCTGNTCTRSDSLAGGASYPVITVLVNVPASGPTQVTNQVSVSGGGSQGASASDPTTIGPSNSTGGIYFYPVTPCRVADTRNTTGPFGGPIIPGNSIRTFSVPSSACAIPSNAQAYSLNITVVPPATLGYLTIWPTGQAQPNVSTLNSSNGAIIANAAIVPAGTGGSISVYVSNTTHVIIDINGYFAPPGAVGALAFYPATPCRIADTRIPNAPFGGPALAGGTSRDFGVPASACNIPSTAKAYSLNMTVVPVAPLGYLTVWPTGQTQPYVSTLNALQGQIAANAAIVPAGTTGPGSISVFVTDTSNVIIDVNGYFAPPGSPGALYFYPLTPCRVADTRGASGMFGGPSLGAGATRNLPIPTSACSVPATALAYSFNITVVPAGSLLYLSTWPAGQTLPVVSTLNDMQGQIVANAAIVPAGTGGTVCVFVSDQANVIIDINGYFAP